MPPKTQRPLDPLEIERIKKIANKTFIPRMEYWPPNKFKPILLEAFTNKAKTVTLDEKVFNIKYYPDGAIWIHPAGVEFAPCGWFNIDTLQKEVEIANAE